MGGTVERMVGRYELVGVNGSLLPAEVGDDSEPDAGLRAFLLEGALCLSADCTYDLSLTARYDTPAGTSYRRELDSGGTWRFLASALDESSGEITQVSTNGRTSSAAVTRLALIPRTRGPWASKGRGTCTWVYLRRSPS